MNEGEIQERLIQAVEIEAAAHRGRIGPAHARSLPLPYQHSQEDRKGWGVFHQREETDRIWRGIMARPTAKQISDAEEADSWYALVRSAENRAALAAWARCMATSELFQDWCFGENIHPVTGTRRKNRAISEIAAHLNGKATLNNETDGEGVLSEEAEIAYFEANIARRRAVTKEGLQSFADDLAFQPVIPGVEHDFSWAEKRNELRRQRAARQRKENEQVRKSA